MSNAVPESHEAQATLQPTSQPAELNAEQLCFRVSLSAVDFRTTEELGPPDQYFSGQERAQAALELGAGIQTSGFNIFVSGLTGTERLENLRTWLAQRAALAPTPEDRVYVQNFSHQDAPRAITLAPGRGQRFKTLMIELVKTLSEELPKAFQQEAFDKEKAQLREKYGDRARELTEGFEVRAREKGFSLQVRPDGMMLIPIINGKPLQSQEEFDQLSDEEKKGFEENQRALMQEMAGFSGRQQEIMRTMREDVQQIERRFCDALVTPLVERIAREIDNPAVQDFLAEVKEHILDNLDDFKERERPSGPQMPFLPAAMQAGERDLLLDYGVNVVVDNADTQGAPVLVESTPTYQNLFGSIERVVDRFGRLVTNFTRIKSGALLRAHGGYLIFNLEDAVLEPAVWKTLKRTLKSGCIEIETYEPFALFSTSGLKPEPIKIRVKVVVVGNPSLYYFLHAMDGDFREIFKVHADFRPSMELDEQHLLTYGQWVANVCKQEELPHFDRAAVERLVEFGARQAGDRQKVSASYADIADLAREAAYWARKENGNLVSARDVEQAITQREFRSNRIEEEMRELITQGTILVDIDGKKVGQVNGLAVLQLGGYAFGRPSRITASVGMGQAGLVNIEREARLSGSSHDKGMLILAGYLRNRYGQDKPLALSASLCFEQSYSGVDGDSASSTELYALLSCLADLPLRQDLAVTGSVNQWGEVQAIGGANEKIEGFFAVCRVQGLTGQQGVMIPASNVRHLLLRAEVIEAVEQGKFHIYPIRTIDEGIELLSGVRAGVADEEGTVNGMVNKRLRDLATKLKSFASKAADGNASSNDEKPSE